MTEEIEEVVPQPEEQQEEIVEEETLTAEQIADLKAKANVSSQNFERAKKAEEEKKLLQSKIQELESQLIPADDFSDPNDVVQTKLAELNAKLNKMEEDKQMESLTAKYPVLTDKLAEFELYRQEYPTAKLESVAKLFLSENDLLNDTPKRKGLEKAGGGQRTAPSNGQMTSDDVKRLRETNFKEYKALLKSGKLKISK